ncbi:hypothetical protein FISHEDRAFT_51327 [Fistulina hepatica ATCC 64428]|uniref:Uncharacterized protein n=1 Tax=Fistulina hepatica ATCC 64428 TaxID=1128425 RepID=A0A0D7A3G2_9AGAR|nr:hypothetical protein FISHEDRAFT_51327 [Fistulina hepatica ATCC 64428]
MFYALFAFVLALSLFSAVHAFLYVTSPDEDTIYYGGESCTVTWLDNGDKPLLSSIGVSFAGLYTGDMQLVQSIEYIDVSSSHSLTFTPLAEAGPDSDD